MKSDNQKTAPAQDGFAIEVTVSERVTVGVQMDSPLTDEEVCRRIIFIPVLLRAPLSLPAALPTRLAARAAGNVHQGRWTRRRRPRRSRLLLAHQQVDEIVEVGHV